MNKACFLAICCEEACFVFAPLLVAGIFSAMLVGVNKGIKNMCPQLFAIKGKVFQEYFVNLHFIAGCAPLIMMTKPCRDITI